MNINTRRMHVLHTEVLLGPFNCKRNFLKSLKTPFKFRWSHNYLQTIRKCLIQSDSLPEMKEYMVFLVSYTIEDSWAENLRIIVEFFLNYFLRMVFKCWCYLQVFRVNILENCYS